MWTIILDPIRYNQGKRMAVCNKCGLCCKILLIKIKKQDLEMRELSRLRNIEIIDLDNNFSVMKLNVRCKYLQNNLCRIYRIRPKICREYPKPSDIRLKGCNL